MGCCASKPSGVIEAKDGREHPLFGAAGLPDQKHEQTSAGATPNDASFGRRSSVKKSGFACFLSHYKIEAATEARWLQQQLEEKLNQPVFLDSDDLQDLSKLQDHVRESKCILLLQTRSVLTRPWCISELLTAIDARVPIVGVSIASGQAPYDFAVASNYMTHLDTLLDAKTLSQLHALGVDVVEAAFKLSNTLPNIISVPLNMNESRSVLAARVGDIVAAMDRAALPVLPAERDGWLAERGNAAAPPLHGPAGAIEGVASHTSVTSTLRAVLPPEVPTLPESAISRPDLMSSLKKRVLNANQKQTPSAMPSAGKLPAPGDDARSITTVTAPARQKAGSRGLFGSLFGNTTAAAGMGGVGARPCPRPLPAPRPPLCCTHRSVACACRQDDDRRGARARRRGARRL